MTVIDDASRVLVTRADDGHLVVTGLDPAEQLMLTALMRALVPLVAEQVTATTEAVLRAITPSVIEAATTAARDVAERMIVARVKTVMRDVHGDVVGIVDETGREP